jgi:hypothetical protein
MLTPAEELGLTGSALAARVRTAFFAMGAPRILPLLDNVREECLRRHVIYMRDGVMEAVRLLSCPVTVLPDQVSYIHYVSLTIQNALKRIAEIYLHDPGVREIVELTPPEQAWLADCWGQSHSESNPVFGRLDAVADFSSPMWKDSLKFMEPNMSGIGGLHLTPTSERIISDTVFPQLFETSPSLRLELGADIRELLMQEVLDHFDVLGTKPQSLCFLEAKYAISGIDEQEDVAQFYHQRYGLKVMHADPSELTLSNGLVYYQGERVDAAYRDYSVLDLLALQQRGIDVEPMRQLMRQNRMISSIAAELDQKALWEIFTDPEFTLKYFSQEERQDFRRHILWTRVVTDRKTRLPDGAMGDLLTFIRDDREQLVLKPNRSYGGDGVAIGLAETQDNWERAIERAVASPDRWVVQQLAAIPVVEFPVVGSNGEVYSEPFYTVLGFAPSKYGVAIMGRASQKQVVNVAQRGGMFVVSVGHPPGRLVGPERV